MANQTENPNRIGFHYYPDTVHYREKDLQSWLPELKAMGAAWITLCAHPERAIPEPFISGLISSGIEPILHFQLPLPFPKRSPTLELLLRTYARWGVRYAALFDRPNLRQAWAPSAWTQSEVAEQFLDMYIPLAGCVIQAGMVPVFPPLEPGGDYWDTVFLQTALRSLQRRNQTQLLECLALSAYAWVGDRPISWGAGGPERWPRTYPYHTPSGSEDQRGFRIFDWYLQIALSELGAPRPLLLLRAGWFPRHIPIDTDGKPDHHQHASSMLEIAQAMQAKTLPASNPLGSVPPEVLACNFWLLAAAPESPHANQAWFQSDGTRLPAAAAIRKMAANQIDSAVTENLISKSSRNRLNSQSGQNSLSESSSRPISHYLLVPLYAWGISEWDLENIRPIIEKYHPTVGFSLDEARLADRVTIAGGSKAFTEKDLQHLRSAGCSLEIIEAGGKIVPI